MGFFDSAYAGRPPWDIGRPQGEFVRASNAGEIQGDALDVGCGTGEHALFLAARGHRALGIDAAPAAIRLAKEKAQRRGLVVDFRVHDALHLEDLGRTFGAVVDCGLFHVFEDSERPRFVEGLSAVLRPGGSYHVLCFSDKEPAGWGPRRIRKAELEAAFAGPFRVRYIREARFEANIAPEGARAHFAWMVRR